MTYKGRLKFGNKEWLLIDNIEYEGVEYLYIIEDISDELNNVKNIEDYEGRIHIEFIYKLDNGNYKNVLDNNLIENLLAIVGARKIFTDEEFV